MSKQKRAIANTEVVGQQRYRTYKASISRIKESIDNGYYLEAIALCESLIADRLEHRLKYLTESDQYSFNTLGKLQEGIIKHDSIEALKKMMFFQKGDLDKWRNKRNNALHAMAKIEDGDSREWEDKIAECREIVLEGETLRREVFRLTDKFRKL